MVGSSILLLVWLAWWDLVYCCWCGEHGGIWCIVVDVVSNVGSGVLLLVWLAWWDLVYCC